MPKRMIDTAIWSDERVTELSPHAQLVFFRLILGDDTTTAGSTRVKAKRIAVDTNLTTDEATDALQELLTCDLVRAYDDGWLWLPTFIKYQLSGAPFIASIRRQARQSPEALGKAINRACDAKLAARPKHENGDEPSDTDPTRTATTRTRKSATSRKESKGRPTVAKESQQGSVNHSREVSVPGPVPGQTYGLSVLVGEDNSGDGLDRPGGRPSPVDEGRPNTQQAEHHVYGDRQSELAAVHENAAAILARLTGRPVNGHAPSLTVIPGGDGCADS